MEIPNRKSRTMSIGSATYDLFVRTDHEIVHTHEGARAFLLPLGAKMRVKDVVETCGGGAANTAVGLARLGMDAAFAGVLASDQWGEKLMENFSREGVRTDCTTIVEGEVSSFSIILSASGGERVILYEPGTNAHIHDATFDREQASHMDWVYLSRISDESCVIQDDIINILIERYGPRLTWNPGGCQLEMGIREKHIARLLSHTNLLILNREEALEFTRTHTLTDALTALVATGAGTVCITDGKNGVTATNGTVTYFCPTPRNITVVDTTGAGDAFGTGMTWGFLKGYDLPEALKAGTLNAANVLSTVGAQAGLLREDQLIERLRTTELKVSTIAHPSLHG